MQKKFIKRSYSNTIGGPFFKAHPVEYRVPRKASKLNISNVDKFPKVVDVFMLYVHFN